MRKFALTVIAAALMTGTFVNAQPAFAAQSTTNDSVQYTQAPASGPKVIAFDCFGTTGDMGCGPGWHYRDGWRGWTCYPC